MSHELAQGILGAEVERADNTEVRSRVREAQEAAKDEVWAGYRFVALADAKEPGGLKVIDLGAGHSSASETLCGRIVAALKSQGLLNETIGAGYIERNWPPVFRDSGAWPLVSLRQSFLDGSLTRLPDPDRVIRQRVAEWVQAGDFGLASGDPDGSDLRTVWYEELVATEEIAYEPGVFLLTKARAEALRNPTDPQPPDPQTPDPEPETPHGPEPADPTSPSRATLARDGNAPADGLEPLRHQGPAQAARLRQPFRESGATGRRPRRPSRQHRDGPPPSSQRTEPGRPTPSRAPRAPGQRLSHHRWPV